MAYYMSQNSHKKGYKYFQDIHLLSVSEWSVTTRILYSINGDAAIYAVSFYLQENFEAELRKRRLRSGFKKRMEEKEVRGIIGAVAGARQS